MSSIGGDLLDDYNPNNFSEVNTSVLSITDTYSSSSLILETLLTSQTPLNSTIVNDFTSYVIPPTPINSLIDQINVYRNIHIKSRIKQCNSNLKLNDICGIYSIDNNTNSLILQSNIEFYTFEDIFDKLVNRIIIQKLKKFCLSNNWCLENLSQNDIQYTNEVIQTQGHSFCSLEQCHSRLSVFIDSCPTLSNTNISIPTYKLLPMLCTLYNEQQSWSSNQCIEKIVYLLHILYAFWPQIETCYHDTYAGSDGCQSECQTFYNILNIIENQCDGYASFLSRVPALAWYQSINLTEICHQKNISSTPPLIYSVQKLFSSNKFWCKFYEKSIYIISIIIFIFIFLLISFLLYFYLNSKYRRNSNNLRFDNNYEYTRLNCSSFELGTNTEIPNTHLTTNEMIHDESQFDSNDRSRSSEYQRLLFVNS